MTNHVAALEQVTKSFGSRDALADVSFAAERGAVLALLGPNGAGKTTALSLLVGLRKPDRGRALLFGADPRRTGSRRRLGVTPQESAFPPTLRVDEIVALVRAHYPLPAPTGELLDQFGLTGLAKRQAGGLSGGERRRLSLALSFAGSPELVLLDEATTGLDVESRTAAWDAIRVYAAGGGTVVLTTHYLEEAERLATEIVVIDQGAVVKQGTVEEIRSSSGFGRVRFKAEPLPDDLGGRVVLDGDTITVYTAEPSETVRRLVRAGARLDRLEVRSLSLEDALRQERRR
ncbi:MAG TPA: ABC transporter ATP-binding protein [Gaiellaceae bacterium]|nr:ABC transporter ATP-binding protein [Gaiellaceae bacterium]